jgi:uncharacterized membrane protein YeiH
MPEQTMNRTSDRLLLFADLAGIFLFALEGARTAISGNLDFLGVMVLSFATALGGGVIRDLLIGDLPPASLRDWRYPATAFIAGSLVFFLHHSLRVIPEQLIIDLDAAGLSLFAVAGTEKALNFKINPFIAVLLGTITAVGGGVIRDMFLAEIPRVLHSDIYATAALLGSAVMVVARRVRVHPTLCAVLGGSTCFLLRVIAVRQHWNLPKATW